MDTKFCGQCSQDLPISAFRKNAARPDGLSFYCRECFKTRDNEGYRRRRQAAGFEVRPKRLVPEGYKYCPRCEEVKSHDEFTPHRQQAGGLASYCKVCKGRMDSAARFRKIYGLTIEERDALIEAQSGVCAICEKHEAVHVDHDHVTGSVRGVLCFRCNAALGQVADSSETLRRMIDYIERTS